MPLLNFPAPGSTDAKQHLISFGGIDLVPSNSYSYTNLLSYSENFLHPSWFRTANDIVVNKNYDYLDVYLNDYDIVTDSVFKLDKNNTDTGFILTTKTDNAIFGQNISVVANTNYVLSFYAKTYTVANCFYRIVDATNQSNIISSTNYASNSSAQWNRISVPFTTPNNCTLITVILRDSGVSDSTGLITLSNPQLELGNISTFYKPTISTVNTSNTGQFIANAKSILGNLGMYSDTTYNWGEVLPITGVSTTKYNTANVYIDDSDILTKTTIQSANITLYFPEQPRAAYYAGDVIRLIDNITGNITLYSVLNGNRSSVQITTNNNINDSSLTISATSTTVYDKTKLFFDYSNRSVLLEDSNIRKNYYLTEYFKANRSTKVVLQQVEMRESLTYKLIGDLFTVRNSIVLEPDSGNDLLRTGQVKASVIVKPILSKKDYTYINPIKTQVQQPVQSSNTVANLLKIKFPRLTSYIDAKTLGTVGNSRLRELRGVKDNLKSGTMIRNKVPLNSVSFVDLGIKFPKLTQYLKLRETVSLALPINRIESNTVSITASTITDLALNSVKTSYTPIERYLFTIASHLNPIKTSPEIITNSLENLLKPFFTKITPKFSLLGDTVKIISSSGISPVPAKSLKATFSYSYTDVTNTNLKTVSLLKKYNNQGSVYPTMPVIGFSDVQNNLVSTYINDSDILTLTVSNTAPTQSITVNPVVKLQSPAAYFDGYTKYVDTNASSMLAFGPTATIEMMIQPTKRYPLQVIASFYSSDNYNRFVNATGGIVTYSGDFKIHTFSTSGLFTVTSATNNSTVEVLIVGGGGGGGAYYGGGGGGGGVVYLSSAPIILNTYTIIVGSGGTAAVGSVGTNGSLSSAFGARAFGGGAGTNHDVGDGASGGSGGGAASNNSRLNIGGNPVVGDIGLGNTGQSYGNRGGNMLAARAGTPTRAAGGGGAGTAGVDTNSNLIGSTTVGGFSSGGNGIINGINGTFYYYGGGGGGGSYTGMGGAGGLGGGGGGGGEIIARAQGGTGGLSVGEPGTTNGGKGGLNTGGGGGGGTAIGSSGGTGGSGVVIIKYRYKRDSSVYALNLPSTISTTILPTVPVPTIDSAIATGATTAIVSYRAPTTAINANIVSYTVITAPTGGSGNIVTVGNGLIFVSGLTTSTAYLFAVYATDGNGFSGLNSTVTNLVTPGLGNQIGFLVVGGGGGGGTGDAGNSSRYAIGGGGGAGGFITGNVLVVTGSSYTLTVGGGGAGAAGGDNTTPNGDLNRGRPGADSRFGAIVGLGGGGGGGGGGDVTTVNTGGAGGSGGGGIQGGTIRGGIGSPGQGFSGSIGDLRFPNPFYGELPPGFQPCGGSGGGAGAAGGFGGGIGGNTTVVGTSSSTSTVTIGSLGYFSVVVTKGINFRVGDSVKVSATANTANWFGGRIFNITTTTSSTTANITVNVHSPGNFSGSGTFSSWRVDMLFASGGGSSSSSGNSPAYEPWAGVGGGGHGGMYNSSPSKWGPRSKATSHSGSGGSGGVGWWWGNVAGTDGGSGTVVLAIPTAVSFTVPSNLSYSLDTTSRAGFNIYRFYAGNGGMSTIAADHSISPSTSPQGMAIDPFGLYLYTAIPGGSIDVRNISRVNGSLSSLGNYTTTGVTPYDLRVDVYGRSVYFNGPTGTSANIGRYTISNGTLTGSPTYVTGGGTYTSGAGYVTGICCDLSGRFVYTGNSTGSAYNIQVFQIQADGSLLSISGGISVASSLTIKTIDIDPTGRFLYAVLSAGTGASGSVLQCSINQTTGALSQIAAPVSALNGAWSLAIHPSGKFLYVIHNNAGSAGSYRFDINQTTGALTAQTNFAMSTDMTAVAFDPLGRFYYVLRSTGTLQSYRIDQFTYALSTLTSISTGTTPVAMVVHPTGDYIYISNFGSNTITQVKLDLSTVSGNVSF